jgi:hypothetical protein
MTDRSGTLSVPPGTRVTRGVVFVHSCPRALCAHVEWALADILGTPVSLDWTPQPVSTGTVRGELAWTGSVGTAARVASALLGWGRLRFEATENPTDVTEGLRFSVTPTLGMYRATVGIHGDIQVPEERRDRPRRALGCLDRGRDHGVARRRLGCRARTLPLRR